MVRLYSVRESRRVTTQKPLPPATHVNPPRVTGSEESRRTAQPASMHIPGTWYILSSYVIRVGLVRTVTRQKQLYPSAHTCGSSAVRFVLENHDKQLIPSCPPPPAIPSTWCHNACPIPPPPLPFVAQTRRHTVGRPPLSLCPSHMLLILWEIVSFGPVKDFFFTCFLLVDLSY